MYFFRSQREFIQIDKWTHFCKLQNILFRYVSCVAQFIHCLHNFMELRRHHPNAILLQMHFLKSQNWFLQIAKCIIFKLKKILIGVCCVCINLSQLGTSRSSNSSGNANCLCHCPPTLLFFFQVWLEEQFSLDRDHHPWACLGNVRLAGYLHLPVTNKVWCSRIESWFSAVEICISSQAYFEALRFLGTFGDFEVC